MRISLDVLGDKQLNRKILRVSHRATDAAPGLRGLADYFRELEAEQFRTEGESGSGGWPELAPSTIARKGHDRVLFESGDLEASLSEEIDERHVSRVTDTELEFGTRVEYARYHQHGTSRMKRRRPVELTETERKEAVRRLQRYLMTGRAK